VQNFARECQSHWRKFFLPHVRYVATMAYRVKVSDTKVTHFTPILALCTCFHRSHLQRPVSMKHTKHSRKSDAQNLCWQCPPFTRTHAFKWLRHCAIADGFGGSVQSWCYAATLLGTRGVNGDYYHNTVLLNMLLPDIRSVFGDYYLFQQDGAPVHRTRDTHHAGGCWTTPSSRQRLHSGVVVWMHVFV